MVVVVDGSSSLSVSSSEDVGGERDLRRGRLDFIMVVVGGMVGCE